MDGEGFQSRREPLYMGHGSWLVVGGVTMRLRLFAGFESVGHAVRQGGVDVRMEEPAQEQQMPMITPEQYAQMQQFAQWQAYQQGYQQAMAQQAQAEEYQEVYEEPQEEWTYDEDPDALPYEMAQIAREEGLVDNRIFMRPEGQKKPEIPVQEEEKREEMVFYPPEVDEEAEDEDWVLEADEDMTDAAQPPRSAYVGHDEAERAKREVWDKYFGGGVRQ